MCTHSPWSWILPRVVVSPGGLFLPWESSWWRRYQVLPLLFLSPWRIVPRTFLIRDGRLLHCIFVCKHSLSPGRKSFGLVQGWDMRLETYRLEVEFSWQFESSPSPHQWINSRVFFKMEIPSSQNCLWDQISPIFGLIKYWYCTPLQSLCSSPGREACGSQGPSPPICHLQMKIFLQPPACSRPS